ncbi:MAG: septal ring lytic transglycosylase RlpA family protein [Bacteroidetes bacterium]|nr:septal ring lytic transglycosylase RlpA family protein [Bacteroidota bacterium]
MRIIIGLFFLLAVQATRGQVQTGKASFYADSFEGSPTASGEKYKAGKFTAAHKILPFGTVVRVTNLANNASVEVTINDRGPYKEGRVIDLSKAAAEKLNMINAGVADVKIEVVDAGDGKTKTPTVQVDHVSVDEKEYYDFKINKVEPSGFGAQVGTYQELVNLFRISETLKSKYKKKITVQVKVVGGVKYYSLILGPFSNQKKAEALVSELKGQFPGAFVLDYSKH